MRVLIPNIHNTLTVSLCRALGDLGFAVYVPAIDEHAKATLSKHTSPLAGAFDFHGSFADENLANCRIVEWDDLASTDIDMVVIGGHGVQRGVLKFMLPALSRRRDVYLVYFCGNESPNYRWDLVTNLLCADEISWQRHGARVPNAARYFPRIDYDRFSWRGPNDSRHLVSCIVNYASRYPDDAALAHSIIAGVNGTTLEMIDKLPHNQVAEVVRAGAATLHIKPEEGYGYSVIESMACGRPVIARRKYVVGRAMQRWCIDGETAMLFDTVDEARQSLSRFLNDDDFRHELQASAAHTIRRIIDNSEQEAILRNFIARLLPQPAKTLKNHWLDIRWRHRQHAPVR